MARKQDRNLGAGDGQEQEQKQEQEDDSQQAPPAAQAQERDDEEDFPRPPGQSELLLTLARLDLEAASAYEVIAAEVGEEEIRAQLLEFRDDHRRHGEELRALCKARGTSAGGVAPEPVSSSLLHSLAELVRPLGSGFAIVTLIANEHLTNASYEAALEYEWSDEEIEFLDRAFLDEQDHLEWLLAQENAMMGEGGEAPAERPDVRA